MDYGQACRQTFINRITEGLPGSLIEASLFQNYSEIFHRRLLLLASEGLVEPVSHLIGRRVHGDVASGANIQIGHT
jgi:hypothetical protein